MPKAENSSRLTNSFGQPGALEWGLFLTASKARVSAHKYLYLAFVPRVGKIFEPMKWDWDGEWMPPDCIEELEARLSAIVHYHLSLHDQTKLDFPD